MYHCRTFSYGSANQYPISNSCLVVLYKDLSLVSAITSLKEMVDPQYWLNPRTIVSVQVRVGDVWVGVVWACILTFVCLRGKIWVGEWCRKVVGSCEVQQGCEVLCYSSS